MSDLTLNENYRIGTDELPNGKVRAKARGSRSTATKTFPIGTPAVLAALTLAQKIEGDRLVQVKMVSSNGYDKSDWAIYTS